MMSTQVNVKHCSLCHGDTEYYCHKCQHNLCLQCKKKHVIDIDTKDHDVTGYAEKTKIPPKHVMSARSGDSDNQEPGILCFSTQVNVKHCSLCHGDTEYYCHKCQHNLCLQCKKKHVIDIDTKDHDVTGYAEKTKIPPKHVMSARSGDSDNQEPGEIPEFDPEHRPWRFLPPLSLSPLESRRHHDEIERRLYADRIYHLRGETLYYRHVVLEELRHDVKTGYKEVTIRGQGKAKERAQGLKDLIDEVLTGNLYDRCEIQKTRLSKHIDGLEKNERRYEEYSCRPPVKYLRFIKHKHDPRKNEQKLIKILVQMMKRMKLSTWTRKRQAGIELLLTLLPSPVLQKSTTVKGVECCLHISCVTPDRVWVSDYFNLILTDKTTGDKLHSVEDSLSGLCVHTVNSECELIYIDNDNNINKLSSDQKTTTKFIEKQESPWEPVSVYCSPSSGDLLVGMYRPSTYTNAGEVRRYDNMGKLTQTIPHDNTGELAQTIPHYNTSPTLYRNPIYITENNNGDVVVSDNDRVVVTDREGRLRFFYKGPSSESGLELQGICIDALSRILVCDGHSNKCKIHMINKDGEFLSYLLTMQSTGLNDAPWSLSYDVNNHLLMIGSCHGIIFVYRYINRNLALIDNIECCAEDASLSVSKLPGYSQREYKSFELRIDAKNRGEMTAKAAKIAAEKAATAEQLAKAAAERTATEITRKDAEKEGLRSAREAAEAIKEAAKAAAEAEDLVNQLVEITEEAAAKEEEVEEEVLFCN